MLGLENLIEIVLSQRLVVFFILRYFLFFFLDLVFDGQLVLATLHFGGDHQNVVQSNNDRVVVLQVLRRFQFFSQQIGVLFNHLVDHVLNHTQVEHDVVLSQTMLLLHLVELTRRVVVN